MPQAHTVHTELPWSLENMIIRWTEMPKIANQVKQQKSSRRGLDATLFEKKPGQNKLSVSCGIEIDVTVKV